MMIPNYGAQKPKPNPFEYKPLSQVGAIRNQQVTNTLTTGANPVTQSVQIGAKRDIAARNARLGTEASDIAVGSGFAPGSAVYERALSKRRADVNTANLNDMNRAAGVQRDMYGQALGEAQTIEDTAIAREATEYSRGQALRLEGKADAEAMGNKIMDPKARQAYNYFVAMGMHPQDAYKRIYGAQGTGEVAEAYRSRTQAQNTTAGIDDMVKAMPINPETGDYWKPGEQEAYISQMIGGAIGSQFDPFSTRSEAKSIDAIQRKQRTGQSLTDAEKQLLNATGTTPQMTLQTVPVGPSQVNAFLQKNPSGMVNIEGRTYKVLRGHSPRTGYGATTAQVRHTDIVEVQDTQTGQTKYIYGGQINDRPPQTVEKAHYTPWGF